MKFLSAGLLIIFSLFLSACASYPKDPSEQATHHVKRALNAISKGEKERAVEDISIALIIETGPEKVKELFASNPVSREYYIEYLEKSAKDVTTVYQSGIVHKNLTNVKNSGVLTDQVILELFDVLNEVVAEGNVSGAISFDFSDSINDFSELKSPKHQEIIFNRSIKKLQDKESKSRPIFGLMNFVQKIGVNSDEGRRVGALLPTMNLRESELKAVENLYPKYASTRRDEITARVLFEVKNGDRLFSDDLIQAFRGRVRGVEWVEVGGPKVTTLIIERVLNNEKTLPERTQTVTYAQHEVNIFNAALFMPRNASYLYDITSGGSEIEYGYVVTAISGGKKVHDEVIRGKVGGEYRTCRNARIQNVFGGVNSASFTANDDMQNRCSGPSSVSLEQLRNEVLSKLTEGVLKVPSIKAVHEMN